MENLDDIFTGLHHVQQQLLGHMKAHWRLFLFEGIFFILLGISAIIIPQLFSVFIVIFLGWLMVVAGLIQVSRAIFSHNTPGYGWWLCLGVLQLVVGFLLIADPIAGVLTFAMMLALFFAFEGGIKVYMGLMMRPLPHWDYVLLSGITAMVLAVVILVFWPEIPQLALGIFVGINMIMLGVAIMKIGLRHKAHLDEV